MAFVLMASAFSRIKLCYLPVAILLAVPLQAAEYDVSGPETQVVGDVQYVDARYEDDLNALGRTYGAGYEEMLLANKGVDAWLPGEGTVVRLPLQHVIPQAPRNGVVINVAEYRMYYFSGKAEQQRVATFPISIGRQEWLTPLGGTRIVSKREKPSWRPPKSIIEEYAERGEKLERVIPPGPDNPLGDYAIRLGLPGYLIHGTNKPAGVGMKVTHGCIRMYPEDIAWLFPQVRVNLPVTIVNQPYKFGYIGDILYFEAHTPLEPEEDEVARSMTRVMEAYIRVVEPDSTRVDWDKVDDAFRSPTGIPIEVGVRTTVLP